MKQNIGQAERLQFPFIVIICPMARVAAPLALLVWKMWPNGEVAVRMPHGARVESSAKLPVAAAAAKDRLQDKSA